MKFKKRKAKGLYFQAVSTESIEARLQHVEKDKAQLFAYLARQDDISGRRQGRQAASEMAQII